MTQEIKRSYDRTIESFRPQHGWWLDSSYCILGIIHGIVERRDLPPRERVTRVEYVLARFDELREEERNKKIPHDCERSHTGRVLGEHIEDATIVAQQTGFDKGVTEKK